MHCPLHKDSNRSAQLNVETGVWFCHAGCGGGRVSELIQREPAWVDPSAAALNRRRGSRKAPSRTTTVDLTDAMVKGWTASLASNEEALEELEEERGLDLSTIERFEIGWDRDLDAYTIPVRSEDGTLWNARRYTLHPREGRRKIWSHGEGYGAPRLYPMAILEDSPKSIIICEGEWDALLTIQHGYAAITRTASAITWKTEWGEHFKDKVVYLCHDMDKAGADANKKVGRALRRIAKEVRVIDLPYERTEKHGKDLGDFWGEYGKAEFRQLLKSAQPFEREPEPEELDPSDVNVLDALDSRRVGSPLRLTVTVKGKREPGYSIPAKVHFSCTRDAGDKCNICPMNPAGGEADLEIPPNDPAVLELIESTKGQLGDVLRTTYGAQKCSRLAIDVQEFQSVEVLFARPSVDHVSGGAGDYKNLKLTSVGRHDTMPNNTVEVVGALHPEPRKQLNEFLVWEVNPMETSLDRFELDAKTIKMMKRFRPRDGERPLKKLGRIARSMADHVTRIYGRPEMHAAMDLVFHSALAFDFGGKRLTRGWLELLVVGDTRTGKSEAAMKLSQHYNAGEVISCESASFAGIIGGLQQYGANKEWSINWGVVPLNDRRLVVLDEVGGLTLDQVAEMSDVRSRGIAQLTKIQTEATHARTRLIWCGNPRDGRMSDYTYGVQAIRPLIGNPEDIARFDLAMSVRAGEVPSTVINRAHAAGTLPYTSAASSALLRWAWSRTPEQVLWAKGAQEAVYKAAEDMGRRYTEDPPLVQAANVREKIARVAVALAARLFSTDKSYENIVVKREHVHDATAFMDRLYGMRGFGYAERSRELILNMEEAEDRRGQVKVYLYERPELAKYLRGTGSFRRQDLEEIMNCAREEANAIIHTLYRSRMVRKDKGDVRVEPALHELLREVNTR